MSVLASVGIVLLAMLVMASLQLVPGVFALFYHYASGRFSKQKTSTLSLFFILGAEIISACFFIFSLYISYILFLDNLNPRNNILTWIIVGLLIALAIFCFFGYYRHFHGKDTELFIPRSFAKALNLRARKVKTPSDAFVLGALSNIWELFITLPLFIITATEIMYMHTEYSADHLMTLLYIITPIIPLLHIYYTFRFGRNLANIQKSRVHSKHFHRFIISFSLLTIAIIIICFRILI